MLFKVSMDWMESSFFRAHAYIKSDKFEQAKEDADKVCYNYD